MRTLIAAFVAVVAACGVAHATADPACSVAAHLTHPDFALPKIAAAIKAKKLELLVAGSASSTLGEGAVNERAYPARLQAALAERLPGV
ncbi:MAG: SGNH/GDSL hydrolase family protein, partial [Pseudolabrys sp.]|nr:SGNH/GDSL hydrolase family protein [Pseudolabrys sp.]